MELNRGLLGLVTIASVLAIALVGIAIWLGPNGLAFVLHDERKTAPFVMVDLLAFADESAEVRYRADFADPALALTRALGGELLWEGRLEGIVAGRARDEWPVVMLIRYPSRSAFIDLVTSSEYRALGDARSEAVVRTAVLAADPRREFEAAGNAFVLRLVRGRRDGWRSKYESEWLAEDEGLLERHGGRVVWRAALSPLVAGAGEAFDEIWLYAFDEPAGRTAWSEDIERLTVQSLERRLFDRDVVLLLRAAPTVPATAPPAEDPSEPASEQVNGSERVELAEIRERARLDVGELREAR
jgi:uncharacterized protein (DUF1330 family)